MRYYTVIAILLICIGITLYYHTVIFQFISSHLAVVVWDKTPPIISQGGMYPPSSKDNPTPLTAGNKITLQFAVDDPESGLSSISCAIYKVSNTEVLVSNITDWHLGQDLWLAEWIVPNELNVIYKFCFKAVNKAGLSSSITTWGTTGIPNGVFYINGVEASKTSKIYVSSPELNITFKATSMGNYINNVWITVSKGMNSEVKYLSMTSTGKIWQINYTLKWGTGTYNIQGWFKWRQSDEHMLMSIDMSYGSKMPIIELLGFIFTISGIIILFFPFRH